ncbi:MAG TPA: lytic murein transglycosylase [Solirubrobacteraceae bacterium]|jgi:murein DD-endopeptidase MepM/ murein hydrolase activator NlpD|nr:lytic murein transglycosylase [Solirubrobacteraceae bacterium]
MRSGSSPEQRPDGGPASGDRPPAGRLRLAAGLAGAGVLAIGFGAGIVQSAAQDAQPAAPGEGAAGAPQPDAVPAAQATAESPAATQTDTSTDPATISSTGQSPQAGAPAQPAAAAPEPPAEPAPAAPAAPAEPAPAADPAAQAATDAAPPAGTATGDRWRECPPAEGFVPSGSAGAADADRPAEADPAPAKTADSTCDPAPRKPRERDRDRDRDRDDDRDAPAPRAKPVDRTPARPPLRAPSGVPTMSNPTTSLAVPGPAAIGVPNFFIDKFRIPPFLLPIYQAAGIEYGVRWEVLAAINEIETDYGRNLNVSSAGALGWMQFMPATWKQYGVDANGDGRKDPYNPVDAIFAAARYLEAAGAQDDLRRAIFAYNHADWYVESVLMRARLVGGLPPDLVGSLTGLTQGRFPVAGRARYADDLSEREAGPKVSRGENAAVPVTGDSTRRGILIFAHPGTPAVATHDGTVVARGRDPRLGRFVKVRDAFGNTYTYARLAELEASHPVPKHGEKPARDKQSTTARTTSTPVLEPRAGRPASTAGGKERLFAMPSRPRAYQAGGAQQVGASVPKGRDEYVDELLHLRPDQVTWKRLKPGASVVAGTILGRIGDTASTRAPHVLFEIRPAGRGAPRIDPKPILDGWKLLESTAIYRAKGKNPFFGRDAKAPTIGQILLMSKESLQRRVLANPHVDIYACGRRDVAAGIVDRRVLALLEFLAANGVRPGVTSLQCGHGYYTASGNVSHHSTGTAVDIATVNGIPVMGHQGAGSITDVTIRRILTLQGAMRPDQVISLMTYDGYDNTLAMGDHADHIHVGYRPVGGDPRTGRAGKYMGAILKPGQWQRVIDRLGEIENPVVRTRPSKAALTVTPRRHGNAGRRAKRD